MTKNLTKYPVFQVIKTSICCRKSYKGMTKYPTPQKYKKLKLMQLPAVIAFSGFNKIIQVGLRIPRKQKKGGGKRVVYEETSGV